VGARLERIDELNPKLNAFITVLADQALEEARTAEADFSAENTLFANYYGLPAISVPSGFDSNGLPLGLEIVGSPGATAQSFVWHISTRKRHVGQSCVITRKARKRLQGGLSQNETLFNVLLDLVRGYYERRRSPAAGCCRAIYLRRLF